MATVRLIGGGHKLHPEYIRLISGLPCRRVDILNEFTEGRSGSPVLLVDITPSQSDGPQGHHIVKVVQIRKNRDELRSDKLARNFFGSFMPEIVMSCEDKLQFYGGESGTHGTYVAIVYGMAQGSLLHARPLRLLMQEQAGQIERYASHIGKSLVSVWSEHVKLESSVPLSLVSNNMLRSLMKGGKSIPIIAQQTIGLDTQCPLISLPDTTLLLPNPIAYAVNESYWQGVRGISFPLGPIHGDLHSDNIICLTSGYQPAFIDLAGFDEAVCVYYDLLYLELNILLSLFAHDPDGWQGFVQYLTKSWRSVDRDPAGSAIAVHAAHVLRQLRDPAYKIADKFDRREDFEIAFHLAATAVGLNYVRKAGVSTPLDYLTVCMALLYAAYSLRRGLIYLDVPAPRPDVNTVAYPRPGEPANVSEGLKVDFTDKTWGHEERTTSYLKISSAQEEFQTTPSTEAPSGIELDFVEREKQALDFIERTLLSYAIPSEHIPEFAEYIKRIREFREKQGSSVPPTTDETANYYLWSRRMQELCLRFYKMSYTALIDGHRPPMLDALQSTDDSSPTYGERTRILEAIIELENERNKLLEKRKNDLTATEGVAPGNQWLAREIHRYEERLAKLKAQAPAAWFDVSRVVNLPHVVVSEQPIQVTVRLQNLGRQACEVVYAEILSDNIMVIEDSIGKGSPKRQVKYKASIPPGQFAVVTYSFCFTQTGEATFRGELAYEGQIEGWDFIPTTRISCTLYATPPRLSVARYYRYRPSDTEIIFEVVNELGNRIAYDLAVSEKYKFAGKAQTLRVKPDNKWLRPGATTWIRYSIAGHCQPGTIEFDPESKLEYKDSYGNEYPPQIIEPRCELHLYAVTNRKDVLIARAEQIRELHSAIRSILDGNPSSSQHTIYITGPRGSGKSRLLQELGQRAEKYHFRFVYRLAERSASPISLLLVDVLRAEPFNEESISESLTNVRYIKGEQKEKQRTLLTRYLLGESLEAFGADTWLVEQSVYNVLRYCAEQSPLILAIDDAHELRASRDLQLLGNLVRRIVEVDTPIIFAFAETAEYAKDDLGEADNRLVHQLQNIRNYLKIICRPLSEEYCNQLIDQLIEYPKFDDELKYYVYKLSHGVPQDVADILQWLTTAPGTLELSGNLWTKSHWLSREEIRFENITRLLPRYAREHLETDTFDYLRILSVVGESIPAILVTDLFKRFFPKEPETSMENKIDQLCKLGFLYVRDDKSLKFSHLSRRNSIYEDPEFSSEGRIGKESIRRTIFEIVSSNPLVYVSKDERVLQAVHHLTRCQPEFQKAHVEALISAAKIALNRCDLRLGRYFTQSTVEMIETSKKYRLDAVRLKLLLAGRIVELTSRVADALTTLQEAEDILNSTSAEHGLSRRDYECLLASILNVKARAKLLSAESKQAKESQQLSLQAIEHLEKHKPLRIPLISRPNLHRFPYMDLLEAYLTQFEATARAIDLPNKDFFLTSYASALHARRYERKSTRLAEWLLNAEGADSAQLLRIQMQVGDLHTSRRDYNGAVKRYDRVQNLAEQLDLSFYEGRAVQRLARIRLLKSGVTEPDYSQNDILPALFRRVIDATAAGVSTTHHYQEVQGLYKRALHAHMQVDDRLGAAEAEVALGIIYHLAGDFEDALSRYEIAIGLYESLGDLTSSWICHLGALSVRVLQQDWSNASQVWQQTYGIYKRNLEDEGSDDLFHLDHFAHLAQQIELKLAELNSPQYQLQAVEVQLNELPDSTPNSVIQALFMRQGDLMAAMDDLRGASEAYRSSFDLVLLGDVEDKTYIENARRLIRLYQDPRWKPNRVPQHEQVWSTEEAEYYLSALCDFYLQRKDMTMFLETIGEFLKTLDEHKTYGRFPRTYVVLLRQLLGEYSADEIEVIRNFVDTTVDHLVKSNRYVEAADLLTQTGMQFLRGDVPAELAEKMGVEYFGRSEELFLQAGSDAIIYGLNGIFFGYLMFDNQEGFGRCAVRLLDWTIAITNFEECNALLRDLLADYVARTKLPDTSLAEIINRLEDSLPDTMHDDSKYKASMIEYKTLAHLFLGEKRRSAGLLKSSEYEIKRALRSAVDLLDIADFSRGRVFNLIGLCYSNLHDLPRQTVAYQEAAKYRSSTPSTVIPTGIDLVNLAESYFEYGWLDPIVPLVHTAVIETMDRCVYSEVQLQQMDTSDLRARTLAVSAARARSGFHHAISLWSHYVTVSSTLTGRRPEILALFREELDLLSEQIKKPQLMYKRPLIGLEWPLHYIRVLADESGHLILNPQGVPAHDRGMKLPLPTNGITIDQALNIPIPNAPTVKDLLSEIREIDLNALAQEMPTQEEPVSSFDMFRENLRKMGLGSVVHGRETNVFPKLERLDTDEEGNGNEPEENNDDFKEHTP